MCGIAGFCDFYGRTEENVLHIMTDSMHKRGPDGSGYHFEQTENYNLGLGHRRLSIIDTSSNGSQPFYINGYAIVFNGEIYNYREIKKELEQKGLHFRSGSDTEVVLQSYITWGKQALHRFIGMFAFCIYDPQKKELFCARDRAGVKPFYFSFQNNSFLFASEIKALCKYPSFNKEIDKNALGLYLKYGYVPAPLSIYEQTKKLEPGHYLTVNLKTAAIYLHQYWNVTDFYNQPQYLMDEQEIVEELERLLISASNYRMVADVPVGLFLSGGYDSASVAAFIQSQSGNRLKTFTIGFHEQEYNEAIYAKKVAEHLNTEHHEYYCSIEDAKAIIPLLPEIYDEPFADSSAIPTYLVSRFASKQVKVALSADAGDEVFAGYPRYFSQEKLYRLLDAIPTMARKPLLKSAAAIINKSNVQNAAHKAEFLKGLAKSGNIHLQKLFPGNFYDSEIHNITGRKPTEAPADRYVRQLKANEWLNILLAIEYKTYLPDDILQKVDRAAMANSLEGREPLVDHRLIEFCARIPASLKYKNKTPKYLLKKITHKYIPESIMNRPKMGFGIPISNWLKGDLKELLDYYLSPEKIKEAGIFNVQFIETLKTAFFNGDAGTNNKIWQVLTFCMWVEHQN